LITSVSALSDGLLPPYVKAILESTPDHLRKMQSYGLQHIYHNDGWFLLYCAKELLNSGKLKLPAEEQKRSLSTLIFPDNYKLPPNSTR